MGNTLFLSYHPGGGGGGGGGFSSSGAPGGGCGGLCGGGGSGGRSGCSGPRTAVAAAAIAVVVVVVVVVVAVVAEDWSLGGTLSKQRTHPALAFRERELQLQEMSASDGVFLHWFLKRVAIELSLKLKLHP